MIPHSGSPLLSRLLENSLCASLQHAMMLPVLTHHIRYHQCLMHLDNLIGYVFKERCLLQVSRPLQKHTACQLHLESETELPHKLIKLCIFRPDAHRANLNLKPNLTECLRACSYLAISLAIDRAILLSATAFLFFMSFAFVHVARTSDVCVGESRMYFNVRLEASILSSASVWFALAQRGHYRLCCNFNSIFPWGSNKNTFKPIQSSGWPQCSGSVGAWP